MSPLIAQVNPIYNPAINSRLGNSAITGGNTIPIFNLVLNNLLVLALSIAGLYFFVNLIRGGYEWITAGGDKESVQKARQRILNAIIGAIVTFAVYSITLVVEYFFGFNILSFNIPTV
jgi:hypothetical protein